MRSPNEKKMFDLLLDEIEDTLQDIEQRCLKLESSDQPKELQVIFRSAHNVKGAAQLYGLTEFGAFVHMFEEVLNTLQKLQRPVATQSVDILLNTQSFFRSWIQGLRENEKHQPDTAILRHTLTKHIDELKASGDLTQVKKGTVPSPTPAVPPPPSPSASNSKPTKETVVAETGASRKLAAAVADALQNSPPSENGGNGRHRRSSGTLRIASQKLDEIMQMIGELSIQQGILWHNMLNGTFSPLTCKNAITLNHKTLRDLYELILTLRMQSAESLLQRMERTARDVAREQGKKVAVTMVGAETPLDKSVIELITDPMMHIVRNAIDHGFENDETRKNLGKLLPGRLTIQIQQDSGQVIISISDDGRGLDPQLIHKKALKRGLIPHGKKLKDQDLIQMIFLPGFSTRDQVTEISGRGIGMDIVQKAIQHLGGRIEISSEKGKGTTFQISLPASLEIIEGLQIRVTNQLYVIPRQDVEEIIDLSSFELEPIGRSGRAIRIRKQVVPVETLADYIGIAKHLSQEVAPHALKNANHLRSGDSTGDIALLIRLADRSKLALRIDSLLSQQQIVVRPLTDHLAELPGFTGMTILGNGEPAMILSAAAIGESYGRWTNRGLAIGKEGA